MTPNYTMPEHIEIEAICAYCGEREVMPEESICFGCQQRVKDESISWVSSTAIIQDNKQMWLPGFKK